MLYPWIGVTATAIHTRTNPSGQTERCVQFAIRKFYLNERGRKPTTHPPHNNLSYEEAQEPAGSQMALAGGQPCSSKVPVAPPLCQRLQWRPAG